jgi:peptidyl-prolyl cis-trans isomerase C
MTKKQAIPTVTVNGQVIPPQAIEYEFGRLVRFYSQHMPEEQVRAQAPVLQQRAVDQAIGAKLLFDQAAKLDLLVTDADVDEKFQEVSEQVGGAEKLAEALAKQGLSEADFRAQLTRGQRVEKLIAKVTEGVPDPRESDISAHFSAHKDEYKREVRVQAQHVLVKPKNGSPQAKFDAIAKLNEIRARVTAGGDFGAEAGAHSDCPSGKADGGSLGWFSRGMMVPEFDTAVFSMKVGDLSDVIETPFGFHIIYKNDEEQAVEASFDDVRESIRDFLRHTARGEVVAAYVADLREKATVKIDA